MKKEVLLLIPAFNEANNIGSLLESLNKTDIVEYADILVINDASSDSTNIIAKMNHASVATHVFNLGYGSALQIGYKYAVRCHYQYVIQIDADGQHDICNIESIYKELRGDNVQPGEKAPDIVLCSRFLKGSQSFPISFAKKVAIKYFRGLIKFLTGFIITDPTSGLQGMNWDAFLYFSKYNNFDTTYPDANQIVQTIRYGMRYKEIPCVMHERTTGTSMHSGIIKPIFYTIIVTLGVFNVVLRDRFYKIRRKEEIKLDSDGNRVTPPMQ